MDIGANNFLQGGLQRAKTAKNMTNNALTSTLKSVYFIIAEILKKN